MMNPIYRKIFRIVKSILPKISETEIIALKSGGVSLDRELFQGKVDYKKLFTPIQNPVEDISHMDEKTKELLKRIGSESIYPKDNIQDVMQYLGKNGFLSMIIDKKYGGNRLSIESQSKILSKISSYNPALGVATMVPNSLGPAELIQHYGTEFQKSNYLPKLADGTFIPCFGLTGPNNGSDAVGKIDQGVVEMVNGIPKIKVTLNKRYITLAPVSNLIGIAFHLQDPECLLQNKKSGITLALIERSQPGLFQTTYHNPNNAGFPNGTIKGTIFIDTEQVIGGADKIGEGWKMLMECLAVGRGVSLPATANGSSKFITHSIMNYINLRTQFNMHIGNMEAVKEKFIDMYLNTWIIHTSVKMTNYILDSGSTPSVITAIMKQQTTERARAILNHGMDIYSGSAICTGENNFFTKFYNASPVGITVEGSNTLTRGLIIFGQGLNKSHPYIFPIFESIQTNNLTQFKQNFNNLLSDLLINYARLLVPTFNFNGEQRLKMATLKFSVLTNFVAMLGGKIKAKQMLSGNMSDVLSNLYLGHSLIWYHHHMGDPSPILKKECLEYLMNELEYKMNLVIENYPIEIFKPLLYPLKNKISYPSFENKNTLYAHIVKNTKLHDIIKQDIYYEGTVLEKMEILRNIDPGTKEYEQLYNDIIQVGEFPCKPI